MSATPVFSSIDAVDGDDAQESGVHPSAKLEAQERTIVDGKSNANSSADVGAIARRDAERSLHVRTQFLRRVAHDIASPTGVAMTVLEEIAADSKRPDLVTMARRGLRRLLRLSEQLALAADLEAGDVVPDAATCDICVLVKEALDNAVGIDGRRDVTTSCQLPTMRLLVDVDRRLILSTLREVIGNALKLASSRVAVDVTVVGPTRMPYDSAEQLIGESAAVAADEGASAVAGLSDQSKVEIRIQDDGSGFSDENLATLGDRFTPRSCTRGLGLSLSIAKDVLFAHGGDLRVETSTLPLSRRGTRGAAVVITLPLV